MPNVRRAALAALAVLSAATAGAQLPAQPPASAAAPTDLPLVEVPGPPAGGRALAVLISGDGDWASLVRSVARTLADSGVAVVGLKARSYLSHPRTPEELAADVARVLRFYTAAWGRDEVLLVGYSRGADFVPFVANRLPPDLRARVRLVAMLGPAERASFEFHLSDLVKDTARPTDRLTLPEVTALRGTPMLCVYGREESGSLCPAAPPGLMRVVAREGGHRTGDHATLSALVLDALRGR